MAGKADFGAGLVRAATKFVGDLVSDDDEFGRRLVWLVEAQILARRSNGDLLDGCCYH